MTEEAKKARREYYRKYRERNADKLNSYKRKWSAANPDKIAESQRRYWERKAEQAT